MVQLTAGSDDWTGTTGNEIIDALGGDDTLDGGGGNDSLVGGAGNDFLAGGSGADTLRGALGIDVLDGGTGNDVLAGGTGDDFIFGGSGLDRLFGEDGQDYMSGGADNDTLFGGAGSDALDGGDGNDVLVDGVNPTNYGGLSTENDELAGGTGNDTFYGGYDLMWGGDGNDVFNVKNQGEVYGEVGDDRILLTNGNAALGSWLDGGLGNDFIRGGAGNDTLIAGYGVNTLVGGAGDDSYVITFDEGDDDLYDASPSDVINEGVTGGVDTVYYIRDFLNDGRDDDVDADGKEIVPASTTIAGGTVVLAANVENGVLDDQIYVSNADVFRYDVAWLRGNSLNNLLRGSNIDDILEGGAGADTIVAGDGDDTIIAGVGADSINGGSGRDRIASTTDFDLRTAVAVEDLDLIDGTGAVLGIGNGGNNAIFGNSLDNRLEGLGGNDTLDGLYYSESYAPTTNKATGVDTMVGGTGNDVYRIDSVLDVIVEVRGTTGGNDTIEFSGAEATTTYILGSGVENLTMVKNLVNGIGNNLNNRIISASTNSINSYANVLKGGYGDDYLDGGRGVDTMEGGYGNDTFVVDETSDVIREIAGQGNDWVESAKINLDLNAQGNWTDVENARLTGTLALNATGRETDNHLIGNSGNNTLDGRDGIDTLEGGRGADTYIVDSTTDMLIEVAAEYDTKGLIKPGSIDTVQSDVNFTLASLLNFENLSLSGTVATSGTGNLNANYLRGNDIANSLYGLSGDDTLTGAAGVDTLYGGAGNDSYILSNDGDVVVEVAGEGIDTIEIAGTYSLSATPDVENLTLMGTTAINGTGNQRDNVLIGNSAANLLSGLEGADTLKGGEGADTLVGGTGPDSFDLTESIASKDVIRVAAGDSIANATDADSAIKFAAAYDSLDLEGTIKISTTVATDGVDSGSIRSHRITNGVIKFDDIDSFSLAVSVTTSNLNNVIEYLGQNMTNGETVAFQAGSDTWVFHDGTTDTLIKLVGVTGITALSSSSWGSTTIHVE